MNTEKSLFSFSTFFLVCYLLFGSQSVTEGKGGRIQLKGIITDRITNRPLPYASIGILNKSFGTISDSSGKFNFKIGEENLKDTLQVRLLGYYTTKVLINDLIQTGERNISLSPKLGLKKSETPPLKNKILVVGRPDSGQFIQVSIHNQNTIEQTIGSEIGFRIKNKKKGALLRDFNCFISANNFNQIKFRINVYSVKRELPDSLICSEQIFATASNTQIGWLRVDLLPYNILVNGDFIITLQWIESKMEQKENPITMIPAVMSITKNCYARVACMDKWQRLGLNLSSYVTLLYD